MALHEGSTKCAGSLCAEMMLGGKKNTQREEENLGILQIKKKNYPLKKKLLGRE